MQKDLITRRADGKRLTIGYIARHAYDGIGLKYLKGVYDAAWDYDLNLISAIGGSTIVQREINNAEITVAELLNSQCVDGIVSWASSLSYYSDSHNPELFHERFRGLPLIAIGHPLTNRPSILSDDEYASKLLMSHLFEIHHVRRPVYIQGGDQYSGKKRFEGYLKSLQKHEIPYDPNLVVKTADISAFDGVDALRVLLDERKLIPGVDFDAIATNSDQLSASVIKELQRRGFRVPKDIPVVGFNNRVESLISTPPLTTIKSDFRQYGYLAVEMLLKLIAGQHVPQETLMSTELVIRQSCGCFENSVNDVKTHPEMFGQKETPDSLKESITAAVRQFLPQWLESHMLKNNEYRSHLDSVLDSFLGNLFGTVPPNCFLDDMNRLIMFIRNQKKPLQVLQNFLTRLRCALLPVLAGQPLLVVAEDLWHQARILIFKALEYSQGGMVTGENTDSNDLVQIGGIFNNALSIEEFLDLIVKELPRLGIPGCYMVLYDEMNHSEATSRLILAFNKNGRIDLSNFSHSYPTSQLLPRGIISETERFCVIAQSCFYQDRQLGYVIFEMGPLEGLIYEILRSNFNSSLYSALTDRERRRIEQEREMLLSTLEMKKAELEEKNHDIKLVNAELELAIEKVNLANQAKSRFLANISHEIRTPLNCIIGFTEIMNNTSDHQAQTRYTQLIMDESEKLLELINQLLDISKIEAGKLELNNEPFNLLELMNSLDATYRIIAQRKGLIYISNIDKSLSGPLIGDALRLRQILNNLIGNAVKFTNQGKIETSVEVLKQSSRKITLIFKITDTGVGIPQEKLEAIFDPFVQAEDSTTRKFGGSGLGTTISKELVTLMNGEIGVESKLDQGSTFWFKVVFEKADAVSEQVEPPISKHTIIDTNVPRAIQDAVVMLVEDYPTNREVVLAHLKHFGCKTIIAENGRVAVEKFQAQPVDIILMDLQMPEMDGFTATAAIRKLPEGDQIPIIAMTANAFESDIAECLANGMNDVITKPFRKELFQSKLINWLTQDLKKPDLPDRDSPTKIAAVASEAGLGQPFDLEKVIAEFDNDKTVVFDVIVNFRENLIKQMDIFQKALQENDLETVRRNAHSIKGGAANLGAERLAAAALELEMHAKKGELSKSTESFAKLASEIGRFRQYLTSLKI